MIDKLEYLLALARERHFSRAAVQCGVSQPTLSAGVRSLEDQLGVLLVRRGSRFVGFTPEGERVLDWARRITGDARALRHEIEALKGGIVGRLVLGVIPTAMPMVPRLTLPFATQHPRVRLTIRARSAEDILADLADHRADAGISYLDLPRASRLSAIPLYDERYCYVCERAAAGGATALSWHEAGTRMPLCLLSGEMQNRQIIDARFAAAGLTIEPEVESNSLIALYAHVRTGRWAGIMPEIFADAVSDGAVTAIPIGAPGDVTPVGFITPDALPQTPLVAALLKHARRL